MSSDPCAPQAPAGERRGVRWALSAARRNGVWIYAGGLVFLVFVIVPLWTEPHPAPVRVGGTVLVLLVAVCYLGVAVAEDFGPVGRRRYLGLMATSLLLLAVPVGWDASYYGTYLTIAMAALLPFRQARVAIAVTAAVMLAVNLVREDWLGVVLGAVAAISGLAMSAAIEQGRVRGELARLEQRNAVLAVAAERERIGRDLHDILGHSLTAVAVKAELAGRLIDRDPRAAAAQMTEVEQIARQALGDVRATASGMREVSVATELAAARSVLLAAGIECQAPSATPLLTPGDNELFGFVIREAVTNVVRHAHASVCRIEVEPSSVLVTDDGVGHRGHRGNGLRGLAERARSAQAELSVGPAAGDRGTRVHLQRTAA